MLREKESLTGTQGCIENIFLNIPEFVIHQIPEHPELYITLFKMPTQQNINSQKLTFIG